MNIFRFEFRMYIRSAILWSIAQILLLGVYMAMFPMFSRDAEALNALMKNYPKELMDAFGMSGVDLSSVTGYFGMLFSFVQICLAVQASNYGFSILSIEERERTADFLITKPVKRTKIFNSKVSASILNLTITNLFVWLSSFVFIEVFRGSKGYEKDIILMMLGSIVIFQLFFLTVGMAVSVVIKKVSSVLAFSLGFSFGMYILNAIGSMTDINLMSYVTPFKYFEPGYVIEKGQFDLTLMSVCLGIIMISFIMSFVMYKRRNIHSVS